MLGLYRSGVAILGALMLTGGIVGCSSISSNHIDCNVVKLQSEAGRSNTEIASALGASEADVASCHPPGAMPSAPAEAAPEAAPSSGSGDRGSSSDPGDSSSKSW